MTTQPAHNSSGDGPRVVLACDWFIKYTAGLAGGLAAVGCQVILLTRERSGEIPAEQAGPDGVRDYVRALVGDRVRHLMLPGRVRDRDALVALRSVRGAVAGFSPQVVHVQESALDDPRLLVAARIRRRRYAVTFHDPTPHPGDPVPGLRRRLGERALLAQAGVIFIHSEVDRGELRKVFRTKAPVEVVPHGTGTSEASPVPSEPTLLFFGRLRAYKGLAVLLDALPQVWKSVPEARLVIAGAGELPDHPLLADARVDLRHDHVPEDAVPGLFRAARCVVLPYLQASQSGVGSQAKVYGRPLVVSATGGLPELVADGSGLIVEPGDSEALAAALIDVLAGPGVAEKLGGRAAEGGRAADWPRVAERTIEAYRRHLSTFPARN